ncbi:hypothetical protein CLV49_2406 [Labedella gwakjiensis]|uniref:Glycosyl transferase family 2 n=1 Tax=Labedella gwakjiensis TaxID=390269 RepID=A0A2P8GXT5_9MICO|nr:hypothetical protein [Labedella gwakjiensis]PSL38777.1 hypothetical protein CLV49_2406 [Labedella gwakjiensis]RUQ86744.1 hypothetical protein ELQ93_07200 [Labedella gwakjiensis]
MTETTDSAQKPVGALRSLTARLRVLAARVRHRVLRFRRERARVRYAKGRFHTSTLAGAAPADGIAVVMCLWNRPERIGDILRVLARQTGTPPIRLVLWANRAADRRHYEREIRRIGASGALASVELTTSRVNVGGLGRFFALRRLRDSGYSGPAITLDDDQEIEPTFIRTLLDVYAPRSLHGVWAFRQGSSYWDREAADDGQPADYIGTGGCVLDPSIVDDDGFFTDLPDRYSFLEDQWMSWRAARAGWDLRKVDAPFEFVLAERNQYGALLWLKDEFHAYLASPDRG